MTDLLLGVFFMSVGAVQTQEVSLFFPIPDRSRLDLVKRNLKKEDSQDQGDNDGSTGWFPDRLSPLFKPWEEHLRQVFVDRDRVAYVGLVAKRLRTRTEA